MNKTIDINLGGLPFTIDDDAYEKLDRYLNSLEDYFGDSEGCKEIVADIEDRIAELFKERLKKRRIVNLKDVNSIIDMMGRPEQFEDGTETAYRSTARRPLDIKTGKRLFRDPDDKIVGGVCAGLSAYIGIEDPVWMRLVFGLLFFGAGIGVIPYIILWIVMPEAKTSGDKLAMRGETANVSNIAKTVEEEMQNLGKQISKFGKGFKRKN